MSNRIATVFEKGVGYILIASIAMRKAIVATGLRMIPAIVGCTLLWYH